MDNIYDDACEAAHQRDLRAVRMGKLTHFRAVRHCSKVLASAVAQNAPKLLVDGLAALQHELKSAESFGETPGTIDRDAFARCGAHVDDICHSDGASAVALAGVIDSLVAERAERHRAVSAMLQCEHTHSRPRFHVSELSRQPDALVYSVSAGACRHRFQSANASMPSLETTTGVTLCTHCSLDPSRLAQLEDSARAWGGALSVAVFPQLCNDEAGVGGVAASTCRTAGAVFDQLRELERIRRRLERSLPQCTVTLTVLTPLNAAVNNDEVMDLNNAVGGAGVGCPRHSESQCGAAELRRCILAAEELASRLYPINALRNAAVRAARSELVLCLDVDLVCSRGLREQLTEPSSAAWLYARARTTPPTVFVLPAFETRGGPPLPPLWEALPRTRDALRAMVERGEVGGFQADYFPGGHGATQHVRWLSRCCLRPYTVEPRGGGGGGGTAAATRCGASHTFEPFILAARSLLLSDGGAWDERFTGYGKNKIEHAMRLTVQARARWVVLPHGFVIARAHERSCAWQLIYGEGHNRWLRWRTQALFLAAVRDACATASAVVPALLCPSPLPELPQPAHRIVFAVAAAGKSFFAGKYARCADAAGRDFAIRDADELIGQLIGWNEVHRIWDSAKRSGAMAARDWDSTDCGRIWNELLRWLARQPRRTALLAALYPGLNGSRTRSSGAWACVGAVVAVQRSEERHRELFKLRCAAVDAAAAAATVAAEVVEAEDVALTSPRKSASQMKKAMEWTKVERYRGWLRKAAIVNGWPIFDDFPSALGCAPTINTSTSTTTRK